MNLLIPTRHLERRKLADFIGYSEDAETAEAFEKPYRTRVRLLSVGLFGILPALAVILVFYGREIASGEIRPHVRFFMGLLLIAFWPSVFLSLYRLASLARKRPRSVKSGKEMAVFLREDNPPGIETQFIYVCHDSKTFFTRTFSRETQSA